jgi:DNA-binding MarR family transcriptional regulator
VNAGLVSVTRSAPGRPAVRTVSAEGAQIAERLIEERRASLARLCEHWSPDQNDELAALLANLAREMAREPTEEMRVPVPA